MWIGMDIVLLVARYTFVDALGCIISDVPGVSTGFGSLNIRPPRPGDPAGVDQVPASIPVATSDGKILTY